MNGRKALWGIILATLIVMGTGTYVAPRLLQAGQVNLNTGTEPRNLSDIINFTQKANLAESQLRLAAPPAALLFPAPGNKHLGLLTDTLELHRSTRRLVQITCVQGELQSLAMLRQLLLPLP